MSQIIPLLNLLLQVEESLKLHNMWSDISPSEDALNSKEPFAIDLLLPEEWLQWIFIPKMKLMIEKQQVASGFSISPYFEEVWRLEGDKQKIVELLYQIDQECE